MSDELELAQNSTEANEQASSPFVNWTADQAMQHLLMDVARRFRGVDPEVDRRMDLAAEQIIGQPGVRKVPGRFPGEPNIPLYLEGEPGVGKTSLIAAAVKRFCDLTGLNFVDDKKLETGYKPGPNDFLFVTVNLSGKANTSDVGGLPTKSELFKSADANRDEAGNWLRAELISRSQALGKFTGLLVTEGETYERGELLAQDITIVGDATKTAEVVAAVQGQLVEGLKAKGSGLGMLQAGQEPDNGRMYIAKAMGSKGTRLSVFAPKPRTEEEVFVSDMLPNRRMALLGKARFGLLNFDDVANAGEAVRNMLLEVAQNGKYSGVMDIGQSMVTFTGNMGAEDGTNIQSEQSDAEVSRLFKVQVRDTPKNWSRRMSTKYSTTGVGDCLFAGFIHHMGNRDGIFRAQLGDARSEKGVPKPNSRSLENALVKCIPYFQIAKDSNMSPAVFADQMRAVVKGTASAVVSDSYIAYMKAMMSEAIPLAQELMDKGRLDLEKFNEYAGAGARQGQQDFTFRFADALSNCFLNRISHSDEAVAAAKTPKGQAEFLADAADRLCTGLAQLEPGTKDYCLSRMMLGLGANAALGSFDGVETKLAEPTFIAMAEGFARSVKRGVWGDAEQSKEAHTEFTRVVAGSNLAGSANKQRSRP